MKSDKSKYTAADLDKRVRDRHLASGHLDPKLIEKHLADLVDVEANSEIMPFEQPAISAGEMGE